MVRRAIQSFVLGSLRKPYTASARQPARWGTAEIRRSARRLRKTVHSAEQLVLMELLASERDKAGLTQQKLATRLGKHQSFVAKYEGGERRLDVVEFVTVARAIGADPIRLLRSFLRLAG